jgi:hypothetical protein
MRVIYLLLFISFISCQSVKIKELDFDTIPLAKSKIKEIHEIMVTYDENGKVMYSDNLILYYDSENKNIKEVGFVPNSSDDVILIYENGLLVKKEFIHENYISYLEWKRDKKGNVIEYKHVENNFPIINSFGTYDKNNNPLGGYSYNSKNKKSSSKYEYDYKKRMVKIISFDENNIPNPNYVINYFDKKGYIIKTEYVATGDQKSTSFGFDVEYDNKRNIIRSTSFDSNNNKTAYGEYKYIYDKKGNIIEKNKYVNGKLIEKTTHEITYAEK